MKKNLTKRSNLAFMLKQNIRSCYNGWDFEIVCFEDIKYKLLEHVFNFLKHDCFILKRGE